MRHINIPRCLLLAVLGLTFSASNIAQSTNELLSAVAGSNSGFVSELNETLPLSTGAKARFVNPTVFELGSGCTPGNLNSSKFASELSSARKVAYCNAFQRVANELNSTNWSPALRSELQEIWKVFKNENVKIRPMKRGVSSRIALAAEPFTRGGGAFGFHASVYIRPKYSTKQSFFLLAMHELRHIYDFHQLWINGASLSEAEMEKRGFRIMGRIARETERKEKFKSLPKLWKDSWKMHSQAQIDRTMEERIVKYMRKTSFYRDRLQRPNRYLMSFGSRKRREEAYQAANTKSKKNAPAKIRTAQGFIDKNGNSTVDFIDRPRLERRKAKKATKPSIKLADSTPLTKSQKAGRLPDVLKETVATVELEPLKNAAAPFKVIKAADKKKPESLLTAALANEKSLYTKMDSFVYDQEFRLQCWKKQKVKETFTKSATVSRNGSGRPNFSNEIIEKTTRKKKPSCLIDSKSIDTDAYETFWSASYLDEMPIKFEYFTTLDGKKVARYTVYKPAEKLFNRIAARYKHIKPFRVFVGSIFVSVEDSQIVKFWGGSYPEDKTTGNSAHRSRGSYNATALRQRLDNGLWVTTSLNTVAVANKRGKQRPFSYVVKYKNYRKAK